MLAAAADDVKGGVFYHNVLGIIPSSAESYDPFKAADHWALSKQLCIQALGAEAFPEEVDQPRVIKPGEGLVIGDERGGGRAENGAAAGEGPKTRMRTPAGAMVYQPESTGGGRDGGEGEGRQSAVKRVGGGEGGERREEGGVWRTSSGAMHTGGGSSSNGDGAGRDKNSGRM
jgi:hypothetical protein